MATLAAFFKHDAVQENARRREAIRVQADPYLLRALPNDDIYFYSKRIDNSRVVRQADPAARGECWAAITAAAVLLALGASIVAPQVGTILGGYKLESLKQERQTLINEKQALEAQEAALLNPARLNQLALARNLTKPDPDQVIHLDSATPGAEARNRNPRDSAGLVRLPANQPNNR